MVPEKQSGQLKKEQINLNSGDQNLNIKASPQQGKSQNRAKNNWLKVRQLLIKNNINRGNQHKQQKNLHSVNNNIKTHEESILKNSKNNLYNLIEKQTKIIQIQEQTLIQTQYHIQVQTNNDKSHKEKQQINELILTTVTPLPSVQKILKATQNQQFKQSTKIDTTGFWIWQAEQIMTYFLIKSHYQYRKRQQVNQENQQNNNLYLNVDFSKIDSILQIGAGSSGLAAIVLSKRIIMERTNPEMNKKLQLSTSQTNSSLEVNITDGKIENIHYLKKNIEKNFYILYKRQGNSKQQINTVQDNKNNYGQQYFDRLKNIEINAQFMLWGTQINKKYDIILAADCLFFESYHNQLFKTLSQTMHQNSIALFVNPTRGKSLKLFVQLVKEQFTVDFINFNDEKFRLQQQKVIKSQQFDEDRHLFKFLILKKKSTIKFQGEN